MFNLIFEKLFTFNIFSKTISIEETDSPASENKMTDRQRDRLKYFRKKYKTLED